MIFLPFLRANRLSFWSATWSLTNFWCFFNSLKFFLWSHTFIDDSLVYSLPLRRICIQLFEPNRRWKPAYALHRQSVVLYIRWLVISASATTANKPPVSSAATSLSAVGRTTPAHRRSKSLPFLSLRRSKWQITSFVCRRSTMLLHRAVSLLGIRNGRKRFIYGFRGHYRLSYLLTIKEIVS